MKLMTPRSSRNASSLSYTYLSLDLHLPDSRLWPRSSFWRRTRRPRSDGIAPEQTELITSTKTEERIITTQQQASRQQMSSLNSVVSTVRNGRVNIDSRGTVGGEVMILTFPSARYVFFSQLFMQPIATVYYSQFNGTHATFSCTELVVTFAP